MRCSCVLGAASDMDDADGRRESNSMGEGPREGGRDENILPDASAVGVSGIAMLRLSDVSTVSGSRRPDPGVGEVDGGLDIDSGDRPRGDTSRRLGRRAGTTDVGDVLSALSIDAHSAGTKGKPSRASSLPLSLCKRSGTTRTGGMRTGGGTGAALR